MKLGVIVSIAALSVTITPTFAQLPEDLKRKFDEAERRVRLVEMGTAILGALQAYCPG